MNREAPLSPGATERALSLALAAVLVLLPLLPTGPEYLGQPPGAWVEAALAMLLIVALVSLILERSGELGGRLLRSGSGLSPLSWGWLTVLVAVMGATAVGILQENEVSTPVFQAYLRELPAQLMVPMNQATHPLYPARVGLTFLEGFLAFVLVVWTCGRASDVRRRALTAVSGWTIGFGLTSVLAIIQYVTRYNLNPYWVEVNPNLTRSHSTLNDPNALGSYLCLGLGVAVGLYLATSKSSPKPWARWVISGTILIGLIALGSTVSRSAWVAVVLATVLFLGSPLSTRLFDFKSIGWLRKGAQAVLAVLLLVVILSFTARAWVTPRPGYKPTSTSEAMIATLDPRIPLQDVLEGRLTWWTAGARMFREYPVTGVGLGRFPRLLPQYQDVRQIHENAHNFYLQIAAVMGSIGLATFLFFLAALAATLRLALVGPEESGRWLALGLTVGILAFLLTCLTGHSLLLPSIQLLFATGLAASLVAVGPSKTGGQRLWMGGAVALTLLALLGYTVAAVRAPGPAESSSSWGYVWGLYELEVDEDGEPYRWTGERALFHLYPPPGATEVELVYTVSQAVRAPDGIPAEVSIQVDGHSHLAQPTDDGWIRIVLPLPEEQPSGAPRGVDLQVRVDPPLVPATSGRSNDTRRLGIMLRAPRFLNTVRD